MAFRTQQQIQRDRDQAWRDAQLRQIADNSLDAAAGCGCDCDDDDA